MLRAGRSRPSSAASCDFKKKPSDGTPNRSMTSVSIGKSIVGMLAAKAEENDTEAMKYYSA